MFLDEARLAARLNHPNVVDTYEVGEDEGRYFIAMEYLDGQSISSIAARVGRENLPLSIHLRFLSDTLAGLHYAHEVDDYEGKPLAIVHRDVSPQNVFVTYAGQTKLVDFGIAKASGAISSTRQGIVKGKVGYMAPEQALGQTVDRRTDVYAVGIMLWEAIAKRRLVGRDEPESLVIERRIAGADPKITEVAPEVPRELAAICDKAMRSDPNERYATAAEMRRELERYLQGLPLTDSEAVAAYLEEHFASDRRELRHLVEEEVKGLAAEKSSPRPLILLGTNDPVSTPTLDAGDAPPTAILPVTRQPRGSAFGRATVSAFVLAVIASGVAWLTAHRGPVETASIATSTSTVSGTAPHAASASASSPSTAPAPRESSDPVVVESLPKTDRPAATPVRPPSFSAPRRVTIPRPTNSPAASSPPPAPWQSRSKRTVDETNPY